MQIIQYIYLGAGPELLRVLEYPLPRFPNNAPPPPFGKNRVPPVP